MNVLLGGVPFGCDNIGDEAILECAVGIFRDVCPDAAITVCTNDPEHTAAKLSVDTCPCYGFVDASPAERIADVAGGFDVFVWCGATGLSDYPEVALAILRTAQDHGLKTVLWGVGMNSELNPAFYSLGTGKRKSLMAALRISTLGLWDAVAWEEARRSAAGRRRIAEGLGRADLVVVRDPESRDEVLRCGVTREVHVGADSALILEAADRGALQLSGEVSAALASPKKKVCICISAQREVTARKELVQYLDNVVTELDAIVVFLPMNPITDARLMVDLAGQMACKVQTVLVEGLVEPGAVLAFLPAMDVVVSSRLHLLILASIVHVPIVGISRGSKVDNFLQPYGLRAMGSVEDCDFSTLFRETERLLRDRNGFTERSHEVRAHLLERLESTKALLRPLLCGVDPASGPPKN